MIARKIPGFPNYTIDNLGNVYNSRGARLKQEVTNNGYLRVSLSNESVSHKRFLVHRLVAECFIPNPSNFPQINHIDEDRTNNKTDNLEWCTPLHNLNHSKVIEKASKAKEHPVICVRTGKIYSSIKEASEELCLHHANIVACCNNRRKYCGGSEWRYV